MRDPVAPIPSPFAASKTARGYWHTAGRPPAPPPSGAHASFDPTRLLEQPGDVLGIDRRSRPRCHGERPSSTSGLTAARHVSVRTVLGLETRDGWALVQSLCLSPAGVLVHLFDPLDPELDIAERETARSVFARLAPILARSARVKPREHEPVGSPLAAIGGCVLAPRVMADLSTWVNGRTQRRSRGAKRPIPATLVLVPRSRADFAPIRIPGEIVPLSDPQPRVLGVALQPEAVREFAEAAGAVARP